MKQTEKQDCRRNLIQGILVDAASGNQLRVFTQDFFRELTNQLKEFVPGTKLFLSFELEYLEEIHELQTKMVLSDMDNDETNSHPLIYGLNQEGSPETVGEFVDSNCSGILASILDQILDGKHYLVSKYLSFPAKPLKDIIEGSDLNKTLDHHPVLYWGFVYIIHNFSLLTYRPSQVDSAKFLDFLDLFFLVTKESFDDIHHALTSSINVRYLGGSDREKALTARSLLLKLSKVEGGVKQSDHPSLYQALVDFRNMNDQLLEFTGGMDPYPEFKKLVDGVLI